MILCVLKLIKICFPEEYVSVSAHSERAKSKMKSRPKVPSHAEISSDLTKNFGTTPSYNFEEDVINIQAYYDSNDHLVQIKMLKNDKIPRVVFQILGLIIPYQVHLSIITINSGIDQYNLYEICKFLPLSHITDLCLDDTYLKSANYQIILEMQNFIRHLSLSRCRIDDVVLEAIAVTLTHPLPASKTLSILNLSSNRITDEGAKSLSTALRSNRQLSYLNISDNMLTDSGASYLLDTLSDFPLCFSELLASRSRRVEYLKEKNELASRLARELRAGDLDKRSVKRKPVKTVTKKTKIDKDTSLKSMPETKSAMNIEGFIEKATNLAELTLGEFKDPFSKANTYVKDNIVHCFGNNTLCYLNLAYNNLSFTTVRRLLEVLIYQRGLERKPKGLINISLEGNSIPETCSELSNIDYILQEGLSTHHRKLSISRKKLQSKSVQK
jgi:hypothetical protein